MFVLIAPETLYTLEIVQSIMASDITSTPILTSVDTPLSTSQTTSTTTRTVTTYTKLPNVTPQFTVVTITKPTPDVAIGGSAEEWMTATGARLSQLNVQAQSMDMAGTEPTAATNSTTTTTAYSGLVTSTLAAMQELKTTAQPAALTVDVESTTMRSSTTMDVSSTPAEESDGKSSGAVWDPATADVAAAAEATEEAAGTTLYVTVPAPPTATFFISTNEALDSETLTDSTSTDTIFITTFPTVTVSSTTTLFNTSTLTLTTIIPDEPPNRPVWTTEDSSSSAPGVVTVTTAPLSDTEAAAPSSDTRPALEIPETVVGSAVQALRPETTEISTSNEPPLASVTSSAKYTVSIWSTAIFSDPVIMPTALEPRDGYEGPNIVTATSKPNPRQDSVNHEPTHDFLKSANWMTVEPPTASTPVHLTQAHHRQILQSRYHHLDSPITIWLTVSVLASIICWCLISKLLARRRANREFDLPVHDWKTKPPRPGMRKRASTSQGDVTSSLSVVSGQHASEPDPKYRPHERHEFSRRGSMA